MFDNISINRNGISLEKYQYQIISVILLFALLIPSLSIFRNIIGNNSYPYLIYWGGILLFVFFIPKVYFLRRRIIKKRIREFAITGAVIYIAILFLVGVILKQLESTPYDNSFSGIFWNLIFIGPVIVAREIIRDYCIRVSFKTLKHKYWGIVILTLIIALSEIKIYQIENLKNLEDIIIFIVNHALPILMTNILMTALVYYGGAISGIIYLGIIECFTKSFPFLPGLSWLLEGSIRIVFPIFLTFFVFEFCEREKRNIVFRKKGKNIYYISAFLISVIISWYCVGVFSTYPNVILTGSMEPEIHPGDIVITKKIVEEEELFKLEKGDIINFDKDNVNITHRIQDIKVDKAGNISFITKGDNNKDADDDAVLPNDINGVVIKVFPKLGLPIYLANSRNNVPEGVVDNE